jgi:hypothetical protein
MALDQVSLVGGAALELHDNAPLIKEEESDLVRVVSAEVGYQRTEEAVVADVDYSLQRRDYLHDTQGDQNTINGNTALTWHIQPRRLDAVFYHQVAQQITNRTGPDVTSNQEERSILTAGFDGFLHFSPVDALVLRPRFSDIQFEESDDSNSQRASLAATWTHVLNSLSGLDLTGNYDRVTFDDSSEDYDGQGLMLGYHSALSRLNYQVGVGYNKIDRDEGKDFSGSSVNMGLDYKGESGFSGGATFIRQLTDSSIGLSGFELSNRNFNSNDSNFDEPDTILKNQFDMYVDQRFSAASAVHLGIGYLKEDYKETLQDQNSAYIQLGYSYTLNTFWSVAADVHYERSKFLDDPNDLRYNTTRSTLTVTYKPLRALDVSLGVGQEKRTANVAATEYTDNFAILGAKYRFF